MATDKNRTMLARRIEERLGEIGRSAAAVSRASGYGPDFIRDFLTGRKRRMNSDAIAAIARELGVTVAWLQGDDTSIAEMPEVTRSRNVAVYGSAAGAPNGAVHVMTDVIEWVPCPRGIENVRDIYALFVSGTSMAPRFRHGDIIFVAPHRPVRAGDDVVIQVRRKEGGETETWVKEFVSETPEEIVVRQHNPQQELVFPRAQVVGMHRIIPINELVGV